MRVFFLNVLFASVVLVTACPEDKSPDDFDLADAPRSDTSDDTDDEVVACDDHEDCLDDELCFENECRDRDDVLTGCQDDDDCPDGFACLDDQCEEE